ncbi:hypothetical protein D3C87_1138020 [compost metagenome]
MISTCNGVNGLLVPIPKNPVVGEIRAVSMLFTPKITGVEVSVDPITIAPGKIEPLLP